MTATRDIEDSATGGGQISRLALIGLALAILSVVVLVGAALGYRAGIWDVPFALLTLTKFATYGAGIGVIVSLIAIGRTLPGGPRRGLVSAIVGVVVGAGAFYQIAQQWYTVRTVPFIHDITTDTATPPTFEAVLTARQAEGANAHEYAGPELAAKQQYGYPDIVPFMVEVDQDEAFERARTVAESMDWEIVAADKATGRIEATDTTMWYGFKDDIVIRVSPAGDGPEFGSRIDMRSLSRVGRSDVGKNAARIRLYMAALESSFSAR